MTSPYPTDEEGMIRMSDEHTDLRECPFCGGIAEMRQDHDPKYPWSVVSYHTDGCFLLYSNINRHRSYSTCAEAAAAWNTRAAISKTEA